MSTYSFLLVASRLAQVPPKPVRTQPTKPAEPKPEPRADLFTSSPLWIGTTGLLVVLIIVLGIFSKLKVDELTKRLRFEGIKNKQTQSKLKLAAETISKMEKNPDLIHSREFNLDYLRMRMAEEVFHYSILNQIKIRVKEKVTVALRPNQANEGTLGIASTGRQVDEMFDVEYEPEGEKKGTKRVLFRVEIKLTKLPTQPTSATISQIINCLETYLSPSEENANWQPTIQGRIAQIHWDQKAKPTPLLVLEQTAEGTNVTFRTQRSVAQK